MVNIFKSKYTGKQIEDKLDKVTEVVGNPTGPAVADLTKIQIGNDIYYLPYGSTVSANSNTGEVQAYLNNIVINGIKYDIPSSLTGITLKSGPSFIGNLTIYRTDGGVISDHILTDAGTENIKAVKFYTDGYFDIRVPDGILINSNGIIVSIGAISSNPPEGTYYYFPLQSGICTAYYN